VGYHLDIRRVEPQIRVLPDSVRAALAEVLAVIAEDPWPGKSLLNILPLKDGDENREFTVPFDGGRGLLAYRILPLVDYRYIRFIGLWWAGTP